MRLEVGSEGRVTNLGHALFPISTYCASSKVWMDSANIRIFYICQNILWTRMLRKQNCFHCWCILQKLRLRCSNFHIPQQGLDRWR
jgi:hypothetical protein